MRFDKVEKFRILTGEMASHRGDRYGAFMIKSLFSKRLFAIASSGDASLGVEWEHVSVSLERRTPNWNEMDFVKRLFWDDEECVMQLHPPRSKWINNHEHCLHLWRPINQEIPQPPEFAV